MTGFPVIRRTHLEILQVNLGYRCNQRCIHCHVKAGPERTEMMDPATIDQVIAFLASSNLRQLDLTGGAPEMNPHFRHLIRSARAMGFHVIDRCNLTVLEEPGMKGLEEFLADQRVEIIASLPCYLKENVDHQRGNGVFEASLRVLRKLNQLGYGKKGSGLCLNLVYNPPGSFLPPPQTLLEEDYRRELGERYGIVFNQLYTITNMPIHRFETLLTSRGERLSYMKLLQGAHQEGNLESVMCRRLISVDYQGYVYDCDFNQALGLPLQMEGRSRIHLSELMEIDLKGNPIPLLEHCYGCTAGQGSSCTGVLNEAPNPKHQITDNIQ
ncbi:MAG: arsenosugar biosynthesis radical SAM protein ArsS [Deltaproteobacteria bacterium]|nr:arsenosugar biosynthesis radical SAM protein ArsS [Deltaproteobacteria bacterium]